MCDNTGTEFSAIEFPLCRRSSELHEFNDGSNQVSLRSLSSLPGKCYTYRRQDELEMSVRIAADVWAEKSKGSNAKKSREKQRLM